MAARNLFIQDPLAKAYGQPAPALTGTLGAIQSGSAPNAPAKAAPQGSGAGPSDFFNTLSTETGVPPNVLWALGEESAKDGILDEVSVRERAAQLSNAMASAEDPREAIRSIGGDDLLERSYQIADEMFPTPEQVAKRERLKNKSLTGDALTLGAAGVVEGTGLAGRYIGDLTQRGGDALFGDSLFGAPVRGAGSLISRGGEALQGAGNRIGENISPATQQAIQDSQLTGNIFKPSTISLGEDPSTRGMIAQAARVFGNLAPVIVAGIATGGVGAAVVGGAQGAAAAEDEMEQKLRALAENGELQQTPGYQSFIAEGMSPDEAVEATIKTGKHWAGYAAAPIAGAGGALTSGIARRGVAGLTARSLVPRVAGTAAISAAEEGTQETAETVAANLAARQATGAPIDPMQGSFANFALGAIAGAPIGAAGGAISGRKDQPAQGLGIDAEPTPPAGPIEAAVSSAPFQPEAPGPEAPPINPIFPDFKAGAEVQVSDTDGRSYDAVFLREIGDGVVVRINGQEVEMTAAEFEAARTSPTAEDRAQDAGAEPSLSERASANITPPPDSRGQPQADMPGTVEETDALIKRIRGMAGADGVGVSARMLKRITDLEEHRKALVEAQAPIEATAADVTDVTDVQAPARDQVPNQATDSGFVLQIGDQSFDVAGPEDANAAVQGIVEANNLDPANLPPITLLKDGEEVGSATPSGQIEAPTETTAPPQIEAPVAPVEPKPKRKPKAKKPVEAEGASLGATPVQHPTVTPVEPESQAPNVPHAAPMAPEAEREQPDMLGGKPVKEHDAVLRERERRMFGRMGGMIDGDRVADISENFNGYEVRGSGPTTLTVTAPDGTETQVNAPNRQIGLRGVSAILPKAPRPAAAPDAPAAQETPPPDNKKPEMTMGEAGRAWDAMSEPDRIALLERTLPKSDSPRAQAVRKGIAARSWIDTPQQTQASLTRAMDRDIPPPTIAPDSNIAPEEAPAAAPTDAQKEAGNYKMAHTRWQGLNVTIETAKGQERKGKNKDGEEWAVTMPADYGYIRRTEGADGDHLDIYMGPDPESDQVFVVDQMDLETGRFDEHKVILGADSKRRAAALYDKGFSDGRGKDRRAGITAMTAAKFKESLAPESDTDWSMPFSDGVRAADGAIVAKDLEDKKGESPFGWQPMLDAGFEMGQGAALSEQTQPTGATYKWRVMQRFDPKANGWRLDAVRSTRFDAKRGITSPPDKHLGPFAAEEDLFQALLKDGWKPPETLDPDQTAAAPEPPKTAGEQLAEINPFPDLNKDGDGLAEPQPATEPAPKPKGKAATRPFPDFSGQDINGYDDNTSEDGRNSPSKKAFHAAGKSLLNATARLLKAEGWTEMKDRSGKSIRPIRSNWGGTAGSGEVSLTMQGPNSERGAYVQLGERMNARGGITMLHRINQASDPYGSGTNMWADPTGMTPVQLAEKLMDMHGSLQPKAPAETGKSGQKAQTGKSGQNPEPVAEHIENVESGVDKASGENVDKTPDKTPESFVQEAEQPALTARDRGGPLPREVTQEEWDKKPADYKSEHSDGRRSMLELDPATGATASVPVKIVDETSAPAEQPTDPASAPSAPDTTPRKSLSSLSSEKQDRAALLRARIAERLKTQTNVGLDPEILRDAVELAGLYIEDGYRKFRALLDQVSADMGLQPAEAEPWVRAAYNQARDDLDLDGHDVTDMDNAAAVLAEVRGLRDGTSTEATPSDTVKTVEPEANPDATSQIRSDPQGALEGALPGDAQAPVEGGPAGAGGEQAGRPDRKEGDRNAGPGDDQGGSGRGTEGRDVSEPGRVPDSLNPEDSPATIPLANFRITPELRLGQGGPTEKYRDNVSAIALLKQLKSENRRATPDERPILARYVGWGGLKNAFRAAGTKGERGIAKGWEDRVAEIEGLLEPEELSAARNSTKAAHYTSEAVVKGVWAGAERLGFVGGSVLEPAAGTGNFIGLMPESVAGKSNVMAVEYDGITAEVAKQLYPRADVFHAGFQEVPLPPDQFALAIGNPPFGRDSLHFQHVPAARGRTIHHQFFLASMEALQPDGVLAMVVSRYIMDGKSNDNRLALARMGKLEGAIRLPSTAFKENARTEVITDILFFRKHSITAPNVIEAAIVAATGKGKAPKLEDAERAEADALAATMDWLETYDFDDPAGSGETLTMNRYFEARPEMVLGDISATGTQNRSNELNVTLPAGKIEAALNRAIKRLPKGQPMDHVAKDTNTAYAGLAESMRLAVSGAEPGAVRVDEDGALKLVVDLRDNGAMREIGLTDDTPFSPKYALGSDNKWYRQFDALDDKGNKIKQRKEDGTLSTLNVKETRAVPLDEIDPRSKWGARRMDQVKMMLPIRDAFKRQVELESMDADKARLDANRAVLAEKYRAFTKKHGPLHKPSILALAVTMPDGGLVLAVEDVTSKPGENLTVGEADILRERVIAPVTDATRADGPVDALTISLSETGGVDIERIARLLDTDEDAAKKALSEGDRPLAFEDPEAKRWVSADEYLSGEVRRKWNAANAAGMQANADALAAVMPDQWPSSAITPTLGSVWIPEDIYADFFARLGYTATNVRYQDVTNTFFTAYQGSPAPQWKTSRDAMSAGEIVTALMNSGPIKVMDTFTDENGSKRSILNEVATQESQDKADEIAVEFQDWMFLDPERQDRIVELFNERYNTRVLRQRDGSHLTMPGMSPHIKLHRHQSNGIWRGITDKAVLYDYVVGAGKTFTAIGRIMERRRMGLSRKAMVAVPNHLTEQWAKEWREMYPGAKLLVAGKKDFEGDNRRRMFARVASGDYDGIIIGHSQISMIDIDPSVETAYLEEELAVAQEAVVEAEAAAEEEGFGGFGKPIGVAEAERLVTKLQERLAKIRSGRRDRLITFQQMGVDDLTIDEAHEFKNLSFSSRKQGVVGMGNKAGSKKAMDLHLKVRALMDSERGSVAFLTGTPISNSVSEMYLILRNLARRELQEMGVSNYDAWRTMFVSATEEWEPTESGGLKAVTRLGRNWSNMRTLMDLYYSVADAVSLDDIKKWYMEDKGTPYPVPRTKSQIKNGKDRELVAIQPDARQAQELDRIAADYKNLPSISDRFERNAMRLRLMDQARKISLDARALDPHAQVEAGTGKIGEIVRRVSRIHKDTAADRGTQLIFLDRSVPKSKGDEKLVAEYDKDRDKLEQAEIAGDTNAAEKANEALEKFDAQDIAARREAIAGAWNAYDEIKQQLVAAGVPEGDIRYVQEASTPIQKNELFARVKDGDVRILMGSTPRMGAGTNVQDRLVALHHADVTWKPSDIEQREGRIIRQGNLLMEEKGMENFAVDVIAYATERTVDAKMWDLNGHKLKSINGIRKYDGSFEMEFEDAQSATMAEMAALATGNPLMVERIKLDAERKKLQVRQRGFNSKKNAARGDLRRAEAFLERADREIARDKAFSESLAERQAKIAERSAARAININGETFADANAAADAARASIDTQKDGKVKARWKITIDGNKVTNEDALDSELRRAFGTPGFEAEIAGTTYIDVWDAATAIAKAQEDAIKAAPSSPQQSLPDISIMGADVDVDISPSRFGGEGKVVEYVFVHNGERVHSGTFETKNGAQSAAGIRPSIAKWMDRLTPDAFEKRSQRLASDKKIMTRDLPKLREQVKGDWPQAQELENVSNRLSEVVKALAAGATSTERAPSPNFSDAVMDDDGGPPLPDSFRKFFTDESGAMSLPPAKKWVKKGGNLWSTFLTDSMSGRYAVNPLGIVPGRPLFAELGRGIKSAKVYLRLKEEMDALRNDWHSKMDAVAQDWLKLGGAVGWDAMGITPEARKSRRARKAANTVLMDMMHKATLEGVDPSAPFDTTKMEEYREAAAKSDGGYSEWALVKVAEQEALQVRHAELKKEFDKLPPEFQKMFRTVKTAYTKMADDFEAAVIDNIKAATEIAVRKAKRNFDKETARISDEGLVGEEAEAAMQRAQKKLKKAKARAGWALNARIARLRSEFEANRLDGPYFPLARFGNFFVTLRDDSGKVVSFSRFESSKEAEEFDKAKAKEGYQTQRGALSDNKALQAAVDPRFIADVQGILEDAGADEKAMDAVWQRWLETLPDQSIRTRRIHRKGTEGFENDALRAFTSHVFHGSHQLARLRFGLKMADALDEAEIEADKTSDPVRSKLVVNEMRKRHEFTMNPSNSPISASITNAMFVWYLGATPAAAVVNLSQTTVVGPAVLGAKFKGGVTGAIKQLGRASVDFGRNPGDPMKSKRLTDLEKAALHEAIRRGTIDKTQGHDLASVQETGIEYRGKRERVMRTISFMFHHAEVANRTVTFLAAYRMAKADGITEQAAIDAAADATWKTHFDYQGSSRARYMQGDVARVVTQFKQFTLNMLFRAARDLHQWGAGETPEIRKEARQQFTALTLSLMGHAGIRGVWGYTAIMTLLGMFFPGDGGGDDVERWLHNALLWEEETPGAAGWNFAMGAALNGLPGQITGIDLRNRIGMPDLWFYADNREQDAEDWWMGMMVQVGGPIAGVAQNLARAADYAADDEWWRAGERAAPKAVRDLMKAGRYAHEGVNTVRGDPIVDDVDFTHILTQAMGFTPAVVAERYEQNSRMKNRETRISGQRSRIQGKIANLLRDGKAVPQSLWDDMYKFNRTYPEWPISAQTIRQSMKSRQRASDRNEFGIQINPKINPRIREEEAPLIYQ